MIRIEIQNLVELGAFPSSTQVKMEIIAQQENILRSIKPPITNEEAKQLVKIFGPDDYFGLAWTVLHLVESAPGWPIKECLLDNKNEWAIRLLLRCQANDSRQAKSQS